MKILLCCETFPPGGGGVQKMMHELGMRFVSFGHDVSVVTSEDESRDFDEIDGIKIHSFKVSGNYSNGLAGDVDAYQNFLINGEYDCLLVMAAQQWTLDAMLPILKDIHYMKLHIPCGYSGFYQNNYSNYYKKMENYLGEFDQLIYNSSAYRDINFARDLELNEKINIIPAGASESEFNQDPKLNIRKKLGISDNEFVFLSVGNPPYSKGHREILQAYGLTDFTNNTVLILNGSYGDFKQTSFKNWLKDKVKHILGRSPSSIKRLASKIKDNNKRVIFTELDRREMISLFFEADLFVFASHVEYSPLVIYECLAAGLPFITVPVGNTEELVRNSNGGVMCDAEVDKEGFTKTDPVLLAEKIEEVYSDKEKLSELHFKGRDAWEKYYTWDVVARQIEKLFTSPECVEELLQTRNP